MPDIRETPRSARKKNPRDPTRCGLILGLALSGIGCAGAPAPDLRPSLPPEIPGSWRELEAPGRGAHASALQGSQITAWWRQLGDPVLDLLVESAIAGSLDLRTAAARVAEARALRGLSRAELGPTVSAGLDARASEPLEGGSSSEGYSGSFTASWEADLFGSKRSALAASEADLAASEEQLSDARVSLVAEVVVAYADLRVAEERLRVIEESLESREQTYRLTDFRERAGLASRLELDQALGSREQTRASLSTVQQSATGARLRLALLAGRVPGSLDELLNGGRPEEGSGGEPRPVPTLPESLAVGVPAEALARRPDVRAASHRLEGALARLGVAEAARFPALRLTGSIDSQSPDVSDLFDADAYLANLLAGLTAPIFQSGRIEQSIRVEQARVEQQALAYHDLLLAALSEVEGALASLRLIGRQLEALEGAIVAARGAAVLAEQQYAAGLVDLLVVLDSQRTLLSLQEQHAAARGERVAAFSNLYRALGGGWQTSSRGETDA